MLTLTPTRVRTAVTITPVLRIADPEAFANALAASGRERFIIQPFHADRGDNQFVAGTRSGAIELMVAQLGCDGSFLPAHGQHYEAVHAVLRARWPDLGEGATASGRRSEAPRQRGAAGNTRTR